VVSTIVRYLKVKKKLTQNSSNTTITITGHQRAINGLGLKIELIQDGKPNALIYSRDKLLNSNQVF